MANAVLLSDAVEEYLGSRDGIRRTATNRGDRRVLSRLLTAAGNIQVRNLDPRHGEAVVTLLSQTCAPNTIRTDVARLKTFVKWLHARRYLNMYVNPLATVSLPRVIERPKLRIPARDFGRVLDAAGNPRDRLILALGLYLLVRQSEMKEIRLRDVNLDSGRIMVTVVKTTHRPHPMPICKELDAEIRRWLTWYSGNTPVPLTPEHFLVPARTKAAFVGKPGAWGDTTYTINIIPDRPVRDPHDVVSRVLRSLGYRTRDERGRSLGEGCHTLRRSGALALYDRLSSGGYDGAMDAIQEMLHHTSVATTERYIGRTLREARLDELLRGRAMYGEDENVVRLAVSQ